MSATARVPVAVFRNRLSISDFLAAQKALNAEHGPLLFVTQEYGALIVWKPGERCWCWACFNAERDALKALDDFLHIFPTFIVCPTCGNKRCPRASHHDNPCTASNKRGQEGSVYR